MLHTVYSCYKVIVCTQLFPVEFLDKHLIACTLDKILIALMALYGTHYGSAALE
jgi:hypothetical protein